jgi:hypothetical protein
MSDEKRNQHKIEYDKRVHFLWLSCATFTFADGKSSGWWLSKLLLISGPWSMFVTLFLDQNGG